MPVKKLYDDLIAGKDVELSETQLVQIENYCSSQSFGSLQKWLSISQLLFKLNPSSCLKFLQYVQKNQLPKGMYNNFSSRESRISLYNLLFSLSLHQSSVQKTRIMSQKLLKQSISYANESQQDVHIMTKNILNIGFLQYYQGDLNQAMNIFNRQLEQQHEGPNKIQSKAIGLVGIAHIYFQRRNYAKALETYKKLLILLKTLPLKARIGMAYSFFYLEKYQMAKLSFQRILKLNPECVQALIGLAVVQDKNQNYIQYFRYLSKAAKINKSHPLVLIHLSQHYLIKGDIDKAFNFAHQGLIQIEGMSKMIFKNQTEDSYHHRNDYQQFKARFNNIIGQVEHIRSNFLEALKHYRLASDKGLQFNQLYLVQVMTHPICQDYTKALQILQKMFKSNDKSEIKLLNESLKHMAYLKSKFQVQTKQEVHQHSCEYYYNQSIAYNQKDVEIKIESSNLLVELKKPRALQLLLSAHRILEVEHGIIKPQLLNNIAILQLQNHQYQEADKQLTKCLSQLKNSQVKIQADHSLNQSQQERKLREQGNYLIVMFNYGIVKEKLAHFTEAISIYQQIIQKNKYFIDANIRLAGVFFLLGRFEEAISTLDQALIQMNNDKAKNIRFDKVFSMKAAVLKQWGNQGQAKNVLKQLGKSKDIYTQIYQLSMIYQSLIKRQVENAVLKDFLRPNRELYMKYCHEDPNSAFGYLVLCVLLLTDKRINLKQGTQLFNSLRQHASHEIPIILYNMALFYLNYDDYQKAKQIVQTFKQVTLDSKAQQIIGLSQLLLGKYDKCILSVKKNILLNPTSVKHRYQLIFASQKQCQVARTDKQSTMNSNLPKLTQTLKKCFKHYNFLSKLNLNDYVKYYQSPDHKDTIKNYIQKIKAITDERRLYIGSNIDYYQKLQDNQQKIRKQQAKSKASSLQFHANSNNNQTFDTSHTPFNGNQTYEDQSENSEQIRIRKKEQKKRKAIELARLKEDQMNQKWQEFKKEEQVAKQKKSSRVKQPRQKTSRKRQKKQKDSDQGSQESIRDYSQRSIDDARSILSEGSFISKDKDAEDDIDEPKRKRHEQAEFKQHRHKKKVKKEVINDRISDAEESENPSKEHKKNSKKQDDDLGIDMDQYLIQ